MRDRWPRKSQHYPHVQRPQWQLQIYTCVHEGLTEPKATKAWHKLNPTRPNRYIYTKQASHSSSDGSAFRPLLSGRLAVPVCCSLALMVAWEVCVSCTQEWHITGPRTPGHGTPKNTSWNVPAQGLSSCFNRTKFFFKESALIPRIHLSFCASLICIYRAISERGFQIE